MAINGVNNKDREKLFTQFRHRMGAPLVKIEITDEQLETALELAIEDYAKVLQDWFTEHQWSSLIGINVESADLTKAFLTRSLDYETQFTYAYSKIVGLQANGPWELKKDFVELSKGQQIYTIPKDREINEILWTTAPALNQAVIDPYLGAFSNAFGSEYVGLSQAYVMPAFDIMMRLTDRNLKSRILRSELTYKVQAGPNGTKLLHLSPVPGGRFDFNSARVNGMRCWYHYYEVSDDNRDQCLEDNNDVIKLPSDVPLESLTWDQLNTPAKTWVRQLFTVHAARTLANIRGKFSGRVGIAEAEGTLDYGMLTTFAADEENKIKESLAKYLDELSPVKMMEKRAKMAEDLNRALKYRAIRTPFIYI